MTKRLIYSFAATLFAAASLYAEPPIRAQIPFPFHVGGSVLPAGVYTTDMSIRSGVVLMLRSADSKSSAVVLTNGVLATGESNQPRFVFQRYGDEYFLYQVWTGQSGVGHQLAKSRLEIEVEARAKRGIQTILATK